MTSNACGGKFSGDHRPTFDPKRSRQRHQCNFELLPIHGESSQNQTEETTEEGTCWIQKHA